MLYTLSHSPAQCDLPALLRLIMTGDSILLLQDGVLAGISDSTYLKLLFNTPASLYALQADLEARGLVSYVSKKITIIEYHHFVTLTEKYHSQIAW
ncbi:sulfur transfer protein complex, TusB subunit [Serratia symbiotica str. 'Cinara cedri']|nr:sulfur transfer protein complex, TusB subunit [Serratia symbiotica str. 'Cinara cedri']